MSLAYLTWTLSPVHSTGFAFRFEHRKWNRGRNGLHQLGQPVAPSVLFPAFKSEGEPGRLLSYLIILLVWRAFSSRSDFDLIGTSKRTMLFLAL